MQISTVLDVSTKYSVSYIQINKVLDAPSRY